jgi:hypothetical protein
MLFGKYEDMIMTSIILQNGTNFIDLKYEVQKSILTNIMGLNLFENVRLISFKEYKRYTSNILKKIENEISHTNYDELIEHENKLLIENEDKLKKKNDKNYNLLKEKHIIEYKLNDHVKINLDIITQEKKMLETKQDELVKQIKIFEFIIYNKEDKESIWKQNKLEENKKDYENKIEQIQILINELTKEIKKSNNNNNEKLKFDKIQIEKTIHEIDKSISILKDNINKQYIKNNDILKTILITEKEINYKKKQYDNEKKNITKKLNEKNQIEKSINLQKENNKDLLKHKFSDFCECCINNKIIHEQIGYLEKIIKLLI